MSSYIKDSLISLKRNTNKFIYELETPLNNVVSIEVIRAKIPVSEYTFESDRNAFYVNGKKYRFPIRNFSSTDVISWFETEFDDLTVEEVTRTGRFKFISSSPFSMRGASAWRQLGFEDTKKTYTSKPEDGNYVIEPLNRYDLVGTHVIYIYCDEINDLLRKDGADYTHLAELYTEGSGMTSFQNQYDVTTRYFQPIPVLSKLSLKFFRDKDYDHYYEFRGIEWNILLRIRHVFPGVDWSNINEISVESNTGVSNVTQNSTTLDAVLNELKTMNRLLFLRTPVPQTNNKKTTTTSQKSDNGLIKLTNVDPNYASYLRSIGF